MPKNYRVHFTRTSCGQAAVPIAAALLAAVNEHGPNLPHIDIGGDGFQLRELVRTGLVWHGVFARLREDAPHIVDAADLEREIELEEGDRILDKCHFIYHERDDVLIWQVNRNAGGLSKVQQYLAQAFNDYVELPQVMNDADIQRVLDGQLYEITFGYARPEHLVAGAPSWNQHAFDMMSNVHAAQAKFMLRAPRGGGLAQTAKKMVRQMVNSVGVEKIRIRLTDESDLIELFMAPLHDTVVVEMVGRYPVAQAIYPMLEEAYGRQRNNIPRRVQDGR